jgi:hypothetical protein
MVILKTQSQLKSFIKRQKLNYKNTKGTDGCNVWGVRYNVLHHNDKVLLTEYSYCSGSAPFCCYQILAITKIRTQ